MKSLEFGDVEEARHVIKEAIDAIEIRRNWIREYPTKLSGYHKLSSLEKILDSAN